VGAAGNQQQYNFMTPHQKCLKVKHLSGKNEPFKQMGMNFKIILLHVH
jgi:hypothetical protein